MAITRDDGGGGSVRDWLLQQAGVGKSKPKPKPKPAPRWGESATASTTASRSESPSWFSSSPQELQPQSAMDVMKTLVWKLSKTPEMKQALQPEERPPARSVGFSRVGAGGAQQLAGGQPQGGGPGTQHSGGFGGFSRVGPGGAQQLNAAKAAEQARKDEEFAVEALAGAFPTQEISFEDFKKLGRRQKAVVDLNSLLADATAADKKLEGGDGPGEGEEVYEDLLKELGFGGSRGSDRYAPNTAALIKQLGLNTGNRDLDEFLDMSVGATRAELENLDDQPNLINYATDFSGASPEEQEALTRSYEQRRWADDAGAAIKKAMTATLERGNEILADFRDTMQANRNTLVADLGGAPTKVSTPTGYGVREKGSLDDLFQRAYVSLQRADAIAERPAMFEAMNAWDDEQLNAFFSYADSRSRNERRYGMPELPGELSGVERIPVEEFRDMLGLQ